VEDSSMNKKNKTVIFNKPLFLSLFIVVSTTLTLLVTSSSSSSSSSSSFDGIESSTASYNFFDDFSSRMDGTGE